LSKKTYHAFVLIVWIDQYFLQVSNSNTARENNFSILFYDDNSMVPGYHSILFKTSSFSKFCSKIGLDRPTFFTNYMGIMMLS
jgi:hypothetical protein